MNEEESRRHGSGHSAYQAALDPAGGEGERQHAPSAARTAPVIAGVLSEYLPARGTVLEVASGTGQHVVHFAREHPGLTWLPSDPSPQARLSIEAWVRESGLGNVAPPRDIDLTLPHWHRGLPVGLAAMLTSNLLHISPWEAALGLLTGAGQLLAPGARLFIYGCFRTGGEHLTAGNADFDASLRARDPRWGVRDIDEVSAAAEVRGLQLEAVRPTPADNRLLILRRAG